MTEPKKPAPRRAAGEPAPVYEFDPDTGRFLDGPHPEEETETEAPKDQRAQEGEKSK